MSNRKPPQKASEMLQYIANFANDPGIDFKAASIEKVEAYLAEEQADYTSSIATIQGVIHQEQGKVRLEEARAKRLKLSEQIGERQGTSNTPALRALLIEKISHLAGGETAQAYARKFEDNPTEDLRSLLEDFELIDQLEFDDE